MRIFKLFDLGIQLTLFLASAILSITNPAYAIFCYFFGFFSWNTVSIVVHMVFFKSSAKKIEHKRLAIQLHLLFIVLFFLLMMYVFPAWGDNNTVFTLYIVYTFCMPFYYAWMSFRETRLLEEIHEQVNLLDIDQH